MREVPAASYRTVLAGRRRLAKTPGSLPEADRVARVRWPGWRGLGQPRQARQLLPRPKFCQVLAPPLESMTMAVQAAVRWELHHGLPYRDVEEPLRRVRPRR